MYPTGQTSNVIFPSRPPYIHFEPPQTQRNREHALQAINEMASDPAIRLSVPQGRKSVFILDAKSTFQEVTFQHDDGMSLSVIYPQALRRLGWTAQVLPPGLCISNETTSMGPISFTNFIKVAVKLEGLQARLVPMVVYDETCAYGGVDVIFGNRFVDGGYNGQPLLNAQNMSELAVFVPQTSLASINTADELPLALPEGSSFNGSSTDTGNPLNSGLFAGMLPPCTVGCEERPLYSGVDER